MRIAAFACASIFAGLCSTTLAAADTPLIEGGAAAFDEVWAGGLTKALVEGPAEGAKALRLTVAEKPANFWDAQTWITPLKADIAEGDTVEIKLTARTTAPAAGGGQLGVSVGLNAEPWSQAVAETLTVGTEWKEYTISGVAKAALPAASGRFGFTVGYQAQTIEIAKITVVDLGKK